MNTVVRCDMAAFLFRLAKLAGLADDSWQPTAEQLAAFSDVNSKTPHVREVIWLASMEVSKGWTMADGSVQFRPMNTVVRCDMAAFLHRLYKLYSG